LSGQNINLPPRSKRPGRLRGGPPIGEIITERAYIAGRRYSALVAAARRGWNIPSGSVAFWWNKIVAGPVDVIGGEIKARFLSSTRWGSPRARHVALRR
jgi:hypothetical protein